MKDTGFKMGTDGQTGKHSGNMTIKRTISTLLHRTTQQLSITSHSLGCGQPYFPGTMQHDAGVGFR